MELKETEHYVWCMAANLCGIVLMNGASPEGARIVIRDGLFPEIMAWLPTSTKHIS